MESEEAIMENENNSNVESESNIRDRDTTFNDDALGVNSDDYFDSADHIDGEVHGTHSEVHGTHSESITPSSADMDVNSDSLAFHTDDKDPKDTKTFPREDSSFQIQNNNQDLSDIPNTLSLEQNNATSEAGLSQQNIVNTSRVEVASEESNLYKSNDVQQPMDVDCLDTNDFSCIQQSESSQYDIVHQENVSGKDSSQNNIDEELGISKTHSSYEGSHTISSEVSSNDNVTVSESEHSTGGNITEQMDFKESETVSSSITHASGSSDFSEEIQGQRQDSSVLDDYENNVSGLEKRANPKAGEDVVTTNDLCSPDLQLSGDFSQQDTEKPIKSICGHNAVDKEGLELLNTEMETVNEADASLSLASEREDTSNKEADEDLPLPQISEMESVGDKQEEESGMLQMSEMKYDALKEPNIADSWFQLSEKKPFADQEAVRDTQLPQRLDTTSNADVGAEMTTVEGSDSSLPQLTEMESVTDSIATQEISNETCTNLTCVGSPDTLSPINEKNGTSNTGNGFAENDKDKVKDKLSRENTKVNTCDKTSDKNCDPTVDRNAGLLTKLPLKDKAVESDDDLILVPEIKREDDACGQVSEACPGGVKQEVVGEEDVVVLDDDGEVVPVKKEADDCRVSENGLGIQISEVSGQQHHLHASAESSEALSSGTTKDSSKSKNKSKVQVCIVCQKQCRCKYNVVRNGDVKHLCDDACFKQFRKSPGTFLKVKDPSAPTKDNSVSPAKKSYEFPPQTSTYKTCTVCQLMNVSNQASFCNWKGLDFCGESCLGKFQATLNTTCSFCHAYIPMDMRALYCFKIGNDMRPFCKPKCVSEFKKKLKLCAFCQRDIAAIPGALTATVGSGGKYREFCSQACVKKMEEQLSSVEFLNVNSASQEAACAVCERLGLMKHMVKFQGKIYRLCSELCLSAFQYTNKINMAKCEFCSTISRSEETEAHFIQFEGKLKRFCSDSCVNNFRRQNTKVVCCDWCSTKKLNFDMIERLDTENKYQMFCSLTCLSLYRVNHQAKSNQAVSCDQCKKVVPAQYHLTMSDASVRNFCSYKCVMTFQSQFTTKHQAQSLLAPQVQLPPGPQAPPQQSKAMKPKPRQAALQKEQSFPIISNVISLAPTGISGEKILQIQQPPEAFLPPKSTTLPMNGNVVSSGDGKHQILIQPPNPVSVKNKSLQCRPMTQTKATSCKPHSQSKEVQTDEQAPKTILIPVPVPIYIPMPTVMYTAPAPQIVPFPVPIPVPIFIPTTRKSANGILKAIKDIVERIPADPLEAEILMMAEAVAADGKEGDSDSDSEGDIAGDDFEASASDVIRHQPKEDDAQMRKRDGQGEEDMIQMALRMAEEMSGPIEDLETSVEPVAVNSDPPGHPNLQSYEEQIDDEYIPPISTKGTKRGSRGRPPSTRSKRARVDRQSFADDDTMSSQSQANTSTEPPPDANYRLKFTYGVNAWRHWVIGKNAQIEKAKQGSGGYRIRTFPTDILKCTTDELNFTLCMFIKEVRKPNGDVYSPDSIFYLCLGIQQYLYENSRIDNIFTDLYFERFTDILHEILKSLQPKVNSQGQMLCRIEEEHLWESKQLGAHSPFVLLNTLIYFHTKHFILKTAEEHMSLSFAQILKHWKKGVPLKGQAAAGKNVSLRFYCLANGKKDGLAARKNKEGVPVYEVTENFDNPLRCPVKLYEFFLSKCPESIKNRNDIFYPVPERSCVPDSPVWYSTQSIDTHTMDKMLTRVLLVREIQEAHLHAQPIYL